MKDGLWKCANHFTTGSSHDTVIPLKKQKVYTPTGRGPLHNFLARPESVGSRMRQVPLSGGLRLLEARGHTAKDPTHLPLLLITKRYYCVFQRHLLPGRRSMEPYNTLPRLMRSH